MRELAEPINLDQDVTLQHVREIRAYNDWIFHYLQPHLRGRVLEVGCGIGTYSTRIRPFADEMTCIDMDASYAASVQRLFEDDPAVTAHHGEITGGFELETAAYETIVCLNVLEHIDDHIGALRVFRDALTPGGTLLLQVPAHQWLMGTVDVALGHHRRYTKASMRAALTEAGFEPIVGPLYLYALAIPGWWWVGRVLCRQIVPRSGVLMANVMARISRAVEAAIPAPIGLTLVTAARSR